MDSWSRPSKSQATPIPYYMVPGGENTPYCHSCGRVISQRKTNAAASAKNEARYCSSRCRSHKPGKLDREIEKQFVAFLSGEAKLDGHADGPHGDKHGKTKKGRKAKGDQRILVPCSAVEDAMFGRRSEGARTDGSRTPEPEMEHREHAGGQPEGDGPTAENRSDGADGVDRVHVPDGVFESDGATRFEEKRIIDGDILARMSIRSGTRVRPAQDVSEVNGSVGGEKGWAERIQENEEMLEKRRQGLRRTKEKDMVRSAARRGVVFGFKVDGGGSKGTGNAVEERRMCEAVMNGKVVEPSFAKGDWSIRWRE